MSLISLCPERNFAAPCFSLTFKSGVRHYDNALLWRKRLITRREEARVRWRFVEGCKQRGLFISCELISQAVIGSSAGASQSRLDNNNSGLICPCHSLVCYCASACRCHSLSPLITPSFVPVELCRCSSGWWEITLTHPATRLCLRCVCQASRKPTHTYTFTDAEECIIG